VTGQLSRVGPGITVTQVTNNNQNWNTYADVPAFTPLAHVLAYNSFATSNSISTANLDGSGSQTISENQQGQLSHVTLDGKYVYYQGQNPNQTADIYAVPISQVGPCQAIRLTNLNLVPVAPLPSIVISTSSMDVTGHNVIAYSGGSDLRRVRDDGTVLPDLNLNDPENANVFHRMRLNPKFANILAYKRDQPLPNPNGAAQPEIWVVDLNNPSTVYSVAGSTPADHFSWSIDGLTLGFHEDAVWFTAQILNADGTFHLNGSSGFTISQIGPATGLGLNANYCVWAPDGSVYVCTSGGVAGNPVFLMSLDGTRTKFLSATDSTGTVDAGIPKAAFLDLQHILFSSDRIGTTQVYVISGFTTTFP
jgi:Tol biopolymer transport system component